jgi:hypothetical protein
VGRLSDPDLRKNLQRKCAELSNTSGGSEFAALLLTLATSTEKQPKKMVLRFVATQLIHKLTYLYRVVRPYKKNSTVSDKPAFFSQEIGAEFLRTQIKGDQRFEHLVAGASQKYVQRRHEIADKAYGK